MAGRLRTMVPEGADLSEPVRSRDGQGPIGCKNGGRSGHAYQPTDDKWLTILAAVGAGGAILVDQEHRFHGSQPHVMVLGGLE